MQYFAHEDAVNGPEPLAMGYVYYKDRYQPVPYMNLGVVSGAGSISSNVLDYSKWIKALINSPGPLSKAGHQAIKAGRIISPAEEDSPYTGTSTYALGWMTNVRVICTPVCCASYETKQY